MLVSTFVSFLYSRAEFEPPNEIEALAAEKQKDEEKRIFGPASNHQLSGGHPPKQNKKIPCRFLFDDGQQAHSIKEEEELESKNEDVKTWEAGKNKKTATQREKIRHDGLE